jgi:uncharacterized protein (TIGR03382 family)
VCSPQQCNWDGHFVPADGATVPANLPAIYWRPRRDNDEPSTALVTLTTAADPSTALAFTVTRLPNSIDHLIVPTAPLVPGTQYVITDGNRCLADPGESGPRATFTVGPMAPLPTTLGALSVTTVPEFSTSVSTISGSCWTDVTAAGARVEVDFDAVPELAPWRDVLHVRTFVDGAVYAPRASILSDVPPGESWEGRAVDLVVTVCSSADPTVPPSPNLGVGQHEVEMRATLPGSTVAITSEPTTVMLDCAGPDVGTGGCCSASPHPGGAVALALVVSAWLARRRRGRAASR